MTRNGSRGPYPVRRPHLRLTTTDSTSIKTLEGPPVAVKLILTTRNHPSANWKDKTVEGLAPGTSRQFAAQHKLGSDWEEADMSRAVASIPTRRV